MPLRPFQSPATSAASTGPAPLLWWLLALVALLPPVFLMPAVPIDETRYLSVAWNMHVNGQWLVPHINGMPYSDKPPLLFWLINGMWTLTGYHAWGARLLELLVTIAGLGMVRHLAKRLGGSRSMAAKAGWLWLGCAAVAAFSNAIMFDELLTLCSLAIWLGTIDLAERRLLRGVILGSVGIGLGILTKGPVILLVGTLPMLLGPWWSPDVRRHLWSYYGCMLAALVIGAGIGLAWALSAAHAGGPAYANALLFRQTLGRVDQSFAHRRPIWWYLPILPLMALPWTVSLWRNRNGGGQAPATLLRRFTLAAFVPAFVAFCFISGKQPHYLLPLLPALAVLGGAELDARRLRVNGTAAGVVMLLLGVAVAVIAQKLSVGDGTPMAGYVCAAAVVVMGVVLIAMRRQSGHAHVVGVALLAAVLAAKLAALDAGGIRYDTRPTGHLLARAQQEHIPLFGVGKDNAAFEFAGHLRKPVAHGNLAQARAWVRQHPDGWVFTYFPYYQFAAKPFYSQPYLNDHLWIWHASDLLANDMKLTPRASGKRAD